MLPALLDAGGASPSPRMNDTACARAIFLNQYQRHKSLNGEDMLLLPTLISATRGQPGTFVELGAFTGYNSNTFVLESCFRWSGLLIEASPSNFRQLVKAVRPRSQKVHSAICDATYANSTVRLTLSGGPSSAQLDTQSELHQQRWGWAHAGLAHPCGQVHGRACPKGKSVQQDSVQTVDVPCQPLRRLLAQSGLQDGAHHGATFLSLDVEGAEELVMSTVRPSSFKVIMAELDGTDAAKDERTRQRIIGDGFRIEATLTRQLANSSTVFVRHDVTSYPLPESGWYRVARNDMPERKVMSSHVQADALWQLLSQAARGERHETAL